MRILTYPDKILSEGVAATDLTWPNSIKALIDNMRETMRNVQGIGLAAPQVGVRERIIIIKNEKFGDCISMIDPYITYSEGKSVEEEACLSVPGYSAKVERASAIGVKYYDISESQTLARPFGGRDAIVIQHEIDHLDGILFIDHLSHLKRNMFERKYKKIMKLRRNNTY